MVFYKAVSSLCHAPPTNLYSSTTITMTPLGYKKHLKQAVSFVMIPLGLSHEPHSKGVALQPIFVLGQTFDLLNINFDS